MDEIGGGPGDRPSMRRSLGERVKAILFDPRPEWARIDAEPETIGNLYRSYVIPLAAIGPVAMLIGLLAFGYPYLFRPSATWAVTGAIVQYAMQLVSIYVLALVIDALAPTFGGTQNRVQAFKVAAYSTTASWVAGIFSILPALAVLGLLGLYSLYLLYLGLPTLMKVAKERAVAYILVVIVAMIVIYIVIGAITAAVAGTALRGSIAAIDGGSDASGSMIVPGVGAVDLGKIDAASKRMEAAARQMQATNGGETATATALPSGALQGLLPAALPGGFARTALSSASGGAAGIGGSTAKAEYGAGAATIRLEVTDLGAAGALAGLGSAFNVQSSSQDANGYEKTGKVDGRFVTEKWDNASKSGSYSVLVGNRFMVVADGTGAPIDVVKAAVAPRSRRWRRAERGAVLQRARWVSLPIVSKVQLIGDRNGPHRRDRRPHRQADRQDHP